MKRVFQMFALATIVFSAVACSGASDAQTPQVVQIGVDDASKLKKAPKTDAGAKPGADAAKPGADATKPATPAAKPGDKPTDKPAGAK